MCSGMDAYSSFLSEKLLEFLAFHVVLGKMLQEGEERASGNSVDVDIAGEYFAHSRYCWYVVGKVLVYMDTVRFWHQGI